MAGAIIEGVTADRAAGKVEEGLTQARLNQQRATDRAAGQLEPFSAAGRQGLEQFQAGLDVDFNQVLAGIEDDPFFKFQLEQGLDAVQGSAAAGGNLQSGRTLKALTQFSQGLASQQAQQAFDRQQQQQSQRFNLAQLGFGADTGIANAQLGLGSNLADLSIASGSNRANRVRAIGGAASDALTNIQAGAQQAATLGTGGAF